MTTPVPTHRRLPVGLTASESTRPRVPSASVALDSSSERHVIADAIDSLVHKVQRAALFSGDIERNFKQILDHTRAANEAAQEVAQQSASKADEAKRGKSKKEPKHTSEEGPATLRQADVSFGRAPARTHDAAPWQHGHPVPVHTTHDRVGRDRSDPWHPGEDRMLIPGLPGDVPWEQREHSLGHMNFGNAQATAGDWGSLREHAAQRLNQKLSERTPDAPYHLDQQGRLRYAPGHPDAGKFVRREEAPAAKEEMAAYAKGLNRMANIQGAVNAVGKGGGLSGALGAVGSKLGWVGAAVGAAGMIGGQLSSQRAQNAYYQQIYGGSNVGAIGQRLHEEAFSRFRMFGTMGGDQARQLYRGVSELGIKGDERQSGLDFAVRNYRRTGLDTRTSVDILRSAVENNVKEFSSLSTQLDLVAKSAKQAGVNVGVAQKAFADTYKMVATSVVGGQGTAPVAGGLAAAQAALGQGAVSHLNLGQLASDQTSQALQATAMNMSPLTYANRLAVGGPEAQRMEAQGISGQLTRAAKAALSPQAQRRLVELATKNPPKSEADIRSMIKQMQDEGIEIDVRRAQAVLSGYTRQNINQADAGVIAASALLGVYQKDIQNTLGVTDSGPAANETKTISPNDKHFNDLLRHGKNMDANRAYGEHFMSTHKEDTFVDRLVSAKDANTMRIRVKDGADKDKWVSLQDALYNENYYNQITSGKVQVKSSNDSEVQNLDERFASDDTAKARSKATGQSKGKLEIYATPELRRLLGFNYYGGDEAGVARAQGVPAPSSGTPTSATGVSTGGG